MPVITFATLIVLANDSLPWMPIEQAVLEGVLTSDNWRRHEPDRHFDDCPIPCNAAGLGVMRPSAAQVSLEAHSQQHARTV
jgi:hypothetical protein